MTINVNGNTYKTMQEAAAEIGASPHTIKRWIKEKKLPEPKRTRQGTQQVRIFEDEYIRKARSCAENKFKISFDEA